MSRRLPSSVERAIAGQPWEDIVRACYPTEEQEHALQAEAERQQRARWLREQKALEELATHVIRGEYGAQARQAAQDLFAEQGRNSITLAQVARIAREAQRAPKRQGAR